VEDVARPVEVVLGEGHAEAELELVARAVGVDAVVHAHESTARVRDAPVREGALDQVAAEAVEVRREDALRLPALDLRDQSFKLAVLDRDGAADVGVLLDLIDLDAHAVGPSPTLCLVRLGGLVLGALA
jgi:hypothetical protein